jgi:hypothetical protein
VKSLVGFPTNESHNKLLILSPLFPFSFWVVTSETETA